MRPIYQKPTIYPEFAAHCLEQYPKEAVGCVVGDGEFLPLDNVAENPEETFRVDKIPRTPMVALLHSHTRDFSTAPSRSDMESQQAMAIPWGIVHCNGERCGSVQWFGDQVEIPTLLGRQFVSGWTDCWCLMRDVYRQQFGITLQNIPRDENWWKREPPHNEPLDLLGYERVIETGFVPISQSEMRPGDILMGRVLSEVVNHCALLLPNGLVLHQLDGKGRLSRRDNLNNWSRLIEFTVRHKSFVDDPDSMPVPYCHR